MKEAAIAIAWRTPDGLTEAVSSGLRAKGIGTVELHMAGAASRTITIQGGKVWIDGHPIAGFFLRARPGTFDYSRGFCLADRPFVDVELSATLLAATLLPSVLCINRYDAGTWFEGAGWPVWRRFLMSTGISVIPLRFGRVENPTGCWLPYSSWRPEPVLDGKTHGLLGSAVTTVASFAQHLLVCGEAVGQTPNEVLLKVAVLLDYHGIALSSVATDAEGRIGAVDTTPSIQPGLLSTVSAKLVDRYAEHLRNW